MGKLRLATITLCVLGAGGSALAADMAVKPSLRAVAPAPSYGWTGFYIGGNGGYGWKDPTVTFTPNDPVSQTVTCGGLFGGTCAPPAFFNVHGPLGGLQGGYNYQVNQYWLLGFETDFDWSNITGTGTADFSILASPSSFQVSETVKWFGTVRARVGYLAASSVLLFATGGFAYGRVDENTALSSPTGSTTDGTHSFACVSPGGAGATNCFIGNSSRTATGFAAGGGGEYALWNNVSLKAEYLYVNLGHGNSVNVVAQAPLGGTAPSSFTAAYSGVDFHVVRAGINWKF
jgi:outer membrane immunogenic protein